ncbi:hypothetical protein LP419_06320 [Massilia sp. H-1]|nr:hypothetical protein LP419_06320 [Massilia sp. H-1]
MRPDAGLPPYSYDRADYRPLGRVLFEQWVRPSPLPQRFEAGAAAGSLRLRQPQMAAEVEERSGYALVESDGHRYAWDVDLTQVSLANFNYKKMSLVRDYTQLLADPGANPAFDQVFSIEPRAVETAMLKRRWRRANNGAWWPPTPPRTRPSAWRAARSFIIQGPPGTGKSQTITNLIADYAGRGKRVLFVCEKRAALDVVFNRLKQSGLAPLCSLIHDSQSDKKAFIADLEGMLRRLDGPEPQQRRAAGTARRPGASPGRAAAQYRPVQNRRWPPHRTRSAPPFGPCCAASPPCRQRPRSAMPRASSWPPCRPGMASAIWYAVCMASCASASGCTVWRPIPLPAWRHH